MRVATSFFLGAVLLAGCGRAAPAPVAPAPKKAAPVSSTPDRAAEAITANGLLEHIAMLSSDVFEGRSPGTNGEAITVGYLERQLKAFGLAPGNPDGSYVQKVPLVAVTSEPKLSIAGKELKAGDDYVLWSYGTAPDVRMTASELVFVGYGVVAPELDWDDFKGVDVRGKTVVFLVGDPPVPDATDPTKLDPQVFRGAAMTYYGRWTYKLEMAARKGAAAALIVHETGPAGYGWNVVSGHHGQERFEIATDAARNGHVLAEGWLHEDRARSLFAASKLDFNDLKARAARKDFHPVPLGGGTADIAIHSTFRGLQSRNVVARLPGSDSALRDDYVVYSAHWDHFGKSGKDTFAGALDNASGVAWLLESARAFAKLKPAPRRSVLFVAFTAEEQGLLGSKYYAEHPLYPLAHAVADVNMDIMNPWGRTRAIVSVGQGQTTMDATLAAEAARQGRRVVADPEPEKGYYYRSDHFEFAKRGVPSLGFLFPGSDYIAKPPGFGEERRRDYVATAYHTPRDVIKEDWDLAGAEEDTRLLFHVGLDVANATEPPQWNAGTEFRNAR